MRQNEEHWKDEVQTKLGEMDHKVKSALSKKEQQRLKNLELIENKKLMA